MRFLVDECTGPQVAEWLISEGHDVFSVYAQGRGWEDDDLIGKAYAEGWILITNDKDFGEKVFREHRPHHGVIFIRLKDERPNNKIDVMRRLLTEYPGRLADRFVVVTESRVRFARN